MNKITHNHADENQADLEALLDLSDDLIFFLDDKGNFVKLNKLGALNLDYDPDDLIGRHFFTLLDEAHYQKVEKLFAEMLESGNWIRFDVVLKSRLGIKNSYNIVVKKFSDGEKLSGMGGIAKNITSKIRMETKLAGLEARLIEASRLILIERARWTQDKSVLEELNKLKSEFISNISHELRTPLASIIGFSETIMSDPEMSREMREEFNSIILTEGKRLARLINDILEVSRIESGKYNLVKADVDLIPLIREAADMNMVYFRKKNLDFTFEFPEGELIISCDREKLIGVFDGLLNNAVNFTPVNGRIKIIVHKMSKEVEIIVSDTGVGIPEKDVSQIFQKFYSVSPVNNDIPHSGLGLVFVKQIIDLHKGLILVHSEVNKGTTFVIKLPYQNKTEGT